MAPFASSIASSHRMRAFAFRQSPSLSRVERNDKVHDARSRVNSRATPYLLPLAAEGGGIGASKTPVFRQAIAPDEGRRFYPSLTATLSRKSGGFFSGGSMFKICRPAVSKGVGPACGAVPRSENDFRSGAPQSDGEKPAWLRFPRGDTDSHFGAAEMIEDHLPTAAW